MPTPGLSRKQIGKLFLPLLATSRGCAFESKRIMLQRELLMKPGPSKALQTTAKPYKTGLDSGLLPAAFLPPLSLTAWILFFTVQMGASWQLGGD